jgi:hypothetical protein
MAELNLYSHIRTVISLSNFSNAQVATFIRFIVNTVLVDTSKINEGLALVLEEKLLTATLKAKKRREREEEEEEEEGGGGLLRDPLSSFLLTWPADAFSSSSSSSALKSAINKEEEEGERLMVNAYKSMVFFGIFIGKACENNEVFIQYFRLIVKNYRLIGALQSKTKHSLQSAAHANPLMEKIKSFKSNFSFLPSNWHEAFRECLSNMDKLSLIRDASLAFALTALLFSTSYQPMTINNAKGESKYLAADLFSSAVVINNLDFLVISISLFDLHQHFRTMSSSSSSLTPEIAPENETADSCSSSSSSSSSSGSPDPLLPNDSLRAFYDRVDDIIPTINDILWTPFSFNRVNSNDLKEMELQEIPILPLQMMELFGKYSYAHFHNRPFSSSLVFSCLIFSSLVFSCLVLKVSL